MGSFIKKIHAQCRDFEIAAWWLFFYFFNKLYFYNLNYIEFLKVILKLWLDDYFSLLTLAGDPDKLILSYAIRIIFLLLQGISFSSIDYPDCETAWCLDQDCLYLDGPIGWPSHHRRWLDYYHYLDSVDQKVQVGASSFSRYRAPTLELFFMYYQTCVPEGQLGGRLDCLFCYLAFGFYFMDWP